MITGELKSKIDRIWDTIWSGGISNPLSVIEQLTYLLFIKRLDELHTLKERKAAHSGELEILREDGTPHPKSGPAWGWDNRAQVRLCNPPSPRKRQERRHL